MNTLRTIVLREVLDQFRTFRFGAMFVLVAVVAITGAVLTAEHVRRERTFYDEIRARNQTNLAEAMKGNRSIYRVFRNPVRVCRTPSPLCFIAGAGDRELPNSYAVNAFQVEGPRHERAPNPALWSSEQLDWAFIVGVILSLGALVLSFDAISGERADGTLRLALSNSVQRTTLVIGKMLGAYVPLMVMWVFATMAQLLIWNLLGEGLLSMENGLRVLVAQVPIALFLGFFVALGVLISIGFQSRGTCGTLAALAWAFFILVVPNGSGLVADQLRKLPDPKAAGMRVRDVRHRIRGALEAAGIRVDSGVWWPPDPLGAHLRIADAGNTEWRQARNAWAAQVHSARRLSRLSPASVLRYALEELTGQGFPGYEAFTRRIEAYRGEIRSSLLSIYPIGLNDLITGSASQKVHAVPMNPASFPGFDLRTETISESIVHMTAEVSLLVLSTGLVFLLALVAFARCDVR